MSASTDETATATGAGSTAAAVVETPKGFPEAASRVVDAFTPTSTIRVSFGDKNVEEGTEVTPTEAQVLPTITIEGDKDKLYTVILSDPDAPSVADSKFGEWQHWVLVNAPYTALTEEGGGDNLTQYFGSAPGKDSGKHRYCLVVYEQPEKLTCDEAVVTKTSGFPPRRSFKSREFVSKYKLTPVAALTYLAEWDENVAEFAKKLQGQA